MALNRLLQKADGKFRRELDMLTVGRRTTHSFLHASTFEKHEIFKGLKKRYKHKYPNVINVSLDTQRSIIEELEDPLDPAEAPYLRKDFKKYKMSADGVIYGVRQFEPFQLDQQTLSLLLRNVWRKLRQDAQLVAEMETMERKRMNIEEIEYARGRPYNNDDKPMSEHQPSPQTKAPPLPYNRRTVGD